MEGLLDYPRLITVTTSTKVANSFLQGHGPFWIAYVHAVVTPFPFQSNYGHTSASASAFDCCCCYGIPGGSQVSVVATSFHVISNGIFSCETSCSSLTLDLCSLAEDFNFFLVRQGCSEQPQTITNCSLRHTRRNQCPLLF